MARGRKIDVKVVVEGGGDQKGGDAPFRRGYGEFLRKIVPAEIDGRPIALEIVRGKGRTAAHDKFRSQRALVPNALLILLIDSDAPVADGESAWSFLQRRDSIRRPEWAGEEHAYLMVQCVETWIVSDHAALESAYGAKFKAATLPSRTNLEEEPHDEVQRKLERAAPAYRHGDSAAVVARVDPAALRGLSHFRRLETGLVEAIRAFARREV